MVKNNETNIITAIFHEPDTCCWWKFKKVVKILVAKKQEDVLSVLEELEAHISQQKYYIAGYISYEAASAFDANLMTKTKGDLPLLVFGIFEKKDSYKFDFDTKKETEFVWETDVNEQEYLQAIDRIQKELKLGNTYQVNYTFRQAGKPLNKGFKPIDLFKKISPSAPYGALMEWEDWAIISASPELFFIYENGILQSKPMKGTLPRGKTNEQDLVLTKQLEESKKDQAENVMIVDMIRNDLSKIAKRGTVETPTLFEVEKYPTVLQMTSTVSCLTDASFTDIIKAIFPCASITGAPKVSTMRIIEQLEKSPRNVYTGAMGMIFPSGKMQFNVPIRTALWNKQNNVISYGTGSGITVKSDGKSEFEECLLKTKSLTHNLARYWSNDPGFKIIETMLWVPNQGIEYLDYHLERMEATAEYFGFNFPYEDLYFTLEKMILPGVDEPMKVRPELDKYGEFEIGIAKYIPDDVEQLPKAILAETPVNSQDIFLYHKTTNRAVYDAFWNKYPEADDVILWNEKGELTESCIGNIVVFDGENYFTPPVKCGLLNGIFRRVLLEKNKVKERIILKEELGGFDEIYLVNAIRKWRRMTLV